MKRRADCLLCVSDSRQISSDGHISNQISVPNHESYRQKDLNRDGVMPLINLKSHFQIRNYINPNLKSNHSFIQILNSEISKVPLEKHMSVLFELLEFSDQPRLLIPVIV